MLKHVLGAAGLLLLASPSFALDSETRINVVGDFAENEDVSGIACADPITSTERHCIVVVDEGVAVQGATLVDGPGPYTLTVGDTQKLIAFDDEDVEGPFVGSPPATACPEGVKKANELDAEGVTFADGNYYVTGSHGCGRNNRAARLSAFLVSRFAPGGEPEISFRLNEVLSSLPELAGHAGKDLGDGGISIEAVAALGEPLRLHFGLRSPLAGESAYLLSVDAAALFTAAADLMPQLATLDLSESGADMGIRDLATIDDEPNRVLILVGPALGEGGTFATRDYDVATGELGIPQEWRVAEGGKAEALLLVDRLSTKAKVLVLSDGLKNGAPEMNIVPLHQ